MFVFVFEEEDVNAVDFESPGCWEVVLDVREAVVKVVALGVSSDSERFDPCPEAELLIWLHLLVSCRVQGGRWRSVVRKRIREKAGEGVWSQK